MDGRTLRQEARAERNIACATVDLYCFMRNAQGSFTVEMSEEHYSVRQIEPGESFRAPTVRLCDSAAQQLMDDLWRAGVRPTEGKVSDRTLSAQESHIKDLRDITNKLLVMHAPIIHVP